jgi:hypothetical protein
MEKWEIDLVLGRWLLGRGLKVGWAGKDLKNSKGLVDTNPWWTERSHEKTYCTLYN